ncbi:MAG: FAD-dependent oxidoreductase [Candidatus Melainabacteria bacterium]|nr:MAG: FAD-dependent oxidoreductase [Candidatus Melainabacteria bacterium]
MASPRILIIGGGFAGVKCARKLRQALPQTQYEIVLFNQENHMVFHPLLAGVAGGTLQPKDVSAPLRQMLKGVWCRTESVLSLDLDSKCIEYEAYDETRRKMSFDYLVIAAGNKVDLSAIPGMNDHAFSFKTVGDALALQAHIMEQLEKAEVCDDPAQKKWHLSFVIVGAGFSGVEVAGEINDLVRRSRKFFSHIEEGDISVTIVHSRDQILPELDTRLRAFAQDRMSKAGVRILLNAMASRATPLGITLKDKQYVHGATIVCTIGTSPLPMIQKLNVKKERGRICTNPDMSVPGYKNVWAIGDCAAVINALDGKICPTVAQFAERQAKQVAENIIATLENKPTKPFHYKMMGSMCAIGGYDAVADIMGVRISGFPAWFIWRGVYLMKLPSVFQIVKVGLEWGCDLIFPRTLAHMKADRSKRIWRAFYSAGDNVIEEGDAGTEFYVIERGEAEVGRKKLNGEGEDLIAVLGPGDFFGEGALLDNRPRSASVHARSDLEVTVMGSNVFSQISTALSPLKEAVVKAMNRRTNIWKSLHEVREVLELIPLKALIQPLPESPLSADYHVVDAIHKLNISRLDFLPVTDDDGRLIGMITRSDLLRSIEVAAALPEGAEMNITAKDIMVQNPIAITVSDTAALAIMTMREHGFKVVPVVEDLESRRIVGYVRIENVMDHIAQKLLVREKTATGEVRVTKEMPKLKIEI